MSAKSAKSEFGPLPLQTPKRWDLVKSKLLSAFIPLRGLRKNSSELKLDRGPSPPDPGPQYGPIGRWEGGGFRPWKGQSRLMCLRLSLNRDFYPKSTEML